MHDRQPGAPGQYKMDVSSEELQKLLNGEQCTVVMTRDDQPIAEGTPYNKASVLPDDLAALICPDVVDPTLADALRSLFANSTKMDAIYPIGSIYLSVSNTSPAVLFGGTWERLKDRFLLAAGDTYAAGATGGEATHKLTVDELPSHTFKLTTASGSNTGELNTNQLAIGKEGNTYNNSNAINSVGGNKAHNNMPPYLAVYMWKRTA